MSPKHSPFYRSDLFDPKNLTTIDAIENALLEFSAPLNEHNYERALMNHLDESCVIELMLSGPSETIPLHDWLLDHFPDAKQYESSLAQKLLLRLSQFVMLHLPVREDASILRDHFRSIECAPEALRTLLAMSFLEEEEHTSKWPPSNKKGKAKARQSKQAKRASQDKLSNNAFLLDLNVPIPKNSNELSLTLSLVMGHLKDILQFYLKKLQSPEISLMIKNEFVPQHRPPALRLDTTSVTPAGLDQSVPAAPTTAINYAASLKTVLELERPEGFGDWRIIMASNARGYLRQCARGGGRSFGIIQDKLKQLSHGNFSNDNHKRLAGPSTDVPLFEAKIARNLRLVYQIDCVGSTDATREIQVLKVFGLYTHNQLEHLWPRVMQHLTKRGCEYKRRCKVRKSIDGGNVFAPAAFPCTEETTDDESTESLDNLPGDDYELHQLLSLNKYVTVSKELLKSVWDDRDAAFPFETSQREREIIDYSNSCYVIGRSGTGKTTTMLFKMLGLERAYQLSKNEGVAPLRQIFVTQSRILATRVKEQFLEYLESLSVFSPHFQGMRSNETSSKDADLLAEDDAGDWPVGLPRKYSELSDEHFPLFVTFDQLCTMIEGDLAYLYGVEKSKQGWKQKTSNASDAFRSVTGRRGSFITFDRFLSEYWSHFPQRMTHRLSASLVFSEILGIISGSEAAISSKNNHLDRDAYEGLSQQTYSMFSGQRSVIYDIFLVYLKKKDRLGDYDAADRTHAILQTVRQRFFLPPKIDHLYVDEAQDNLLVDTLLLRLLCRNPNGMFWAGDTAQTISAGSAFRFDDLKAFLFRFERWKCSKQANKTSQYLQIPPKVFHLAVNYRSHAGIVNCAHTLVELLMKYWPKTIDKLSRERGEVSGPKPIFYVGTDANFVKKGHFLSRAKMSEDKVEMGAHQCIIVRDDAAKERLRRDLGDVGLILTLYQSKGLEFNDVFLYNFFHDSNVENPRSWRVVFDAGFDASRHAAICFELKCLYVAITRARNIVRIADDSLIGEPMRNLWLSRDQIRSCTTRDDVEDFAVKSKQEDWADRAQQLFDKQQYEDAKMAYEKAGMSQKAAIANAYHERDVANKMPSTASRDSLRQSLYAVAAQSFVGCARVASRDVSKKYYGIAADCFAKANNILKAAETYRLAERFEQAATHFRSLGKFDEVFKIVQDPVAKASEDKDKLEPLRDVARLYFVGEKQFEKVHQLFDTVEDELEYLDDRNLDNVQVDLLLVHERKTEAAELHLAEGRILEALDLFLADTSERNTSMQRAKKCILEGLWRACPFGMLAQSTPENDQYIDELLARAGSLEEHTLNEVELKELDMFKSIQSEDFDEFPRHADTFLALDDINAAFLCLDHHFSTTPGLTAMNLSQICESSGQFAYYIRRLHGLAFFGDPCDDKRIWKLFGFHQQEQGDFVVPRTSLLYPPLAQIPPKEADPTTSEVIVSKAQLLGVFTKLLQDRLLDRVTKQNDVARMAPALSPCLSYVVYQTCQASRCNGVHVIPSSQWFNEWIKAHLLQIQIYHSITRLQFPAEMKTQRRYWIRKLHEAFHPPHHSFGSVSNLGESTIVDIRQSMYILLEWIRETVYALDHSNQQRFLTTVMQSADLAFAFDKKEASIYMYRSPFLHMEDCPYYFFREPYGDNSLLELLVSLNKKGPSIVLQGITFIQQVMNNRIPIHINILCAFVEKICASLVIFRCYQYTNSLHRVTLPRSWLSAVLSDFDPAFAKIQVVNHFGLLIRPLHQILESLTSFHGGEHGDHLLWDSESISTSDQNKTFRNVYVSRICRVLGLLGCNIRYPAFRHELFRAVTSVRRENTKYPSLFAGYINARSFQDIEFAAQRSMGRSHLDEMVELFDSRRRRDQLPALHFLRRVVFSATEEILPILGGRSRDAIPADPQFHLTFTSYEGSKGESNEVEGIHPADAADEEDPMDLEEVDPGFIPQTDLPDDAYVSHTDEEFQAVALIEEVYHKISSRRKVSKTAGLEGGVMRYSLLCSKTATTKAWTASCLFLGLLPHLLSALDALYSFLLAKKGELKTLLTNRDIKHEYLDEVSASLNCITVVLKGIKAMQRKISPEVFQDSPENGQDTASLDKYIEEAINLFSNLPCELPQAIRDEIDHIFKGFSNFKWKSEKRKRPVPQTSKKERRPALCMEDHHNLLDLDWEEG